MAEEKTRIVWRKGKKYRLDPELLKNTPMYHSNHVSFGVGPTGVSMTFSIRMDSLTNDGEGEDGTLIPQASAFMTVARAERFAKALLEYIDDYKEAKMKPSEEQNEEPKEEKESLDVE